jgi:hypothetical protein
MNGKETLRLQQRRAIKLRGMLPGASLSDEERELLSRVAADLAGNATDTFRFIARPPTDLQDWRDWVVLSQVVTVIWLKVAPLAKDPHGSSFGSWLAAAFADDTITIGSVPTSALHASAQVVDDGYLITVKQGVISFTSELAAIYDVAVSDGANVDEVAERLRRLLDAHLGREVDPADGVVEPGQQRTESHFQAELFVHAAKVGSAMRGESPEGVLTKALGLEGGLGRPARDAEETDRSPGPFHAPGMNRGDLATQFVVLHELAHIYHGDADLTRDEAAALQADFEGLGAQSQVPSNRALHWQPPHVREELYADIEALEAVIELQRRSMPPSTSPIDLAMQMWSPDVHPNLQEVALEGAYLAMTALGLIFQARLILEPEQREGTESLLLGHPEPGQRLDRLGPAAVYDATMMVSVVERVDERFAEHFWPIVQRVWAAYDQEASSRRAT